MSSMQEAAALFNNIGCLLHNLGRYDEAFQSYRNAISIRASVLHGLHSSSIGGTGVRVEGEERQGSNSVPLQQQQQQQQPAVAVTSGGSGTASAASSPTSNPSATTPPLLSVDQDIAQRLNDARELYRNMLLEKQSDENRPDLDETGINAGGFDSSDSFAPSEHGATLDFLSISRHGEERRAATSRYHLLCPSRPIALYVNEEFARLEEEMENNGGGTRSINTLPTTPTPSSSSSSRAASWGTGTTASATSFPGDDQSYDEYLGSGVTLFNMALVFNHHPASGNLESAQRLMTMALSVLPPSSSVYALVLTCDAYVHYQAGSLQSASNSLSQALTLLSSGVEEIRGEDDSGAASRRPSIPNREISVAVFSLLIRIHYENGDCSAALENGNVLMHFVKNAFGSDSVQTAIVHYNLSIILFAAGKIEQTFEHGKIFLDLIFEGRDQPPLDRNSSRGNGADLVLSADARRIFCNQFLRRKMAEAIHTLGRLYVEEASGVQKGLILLEKALALRTEWLSKADQDVEESHIRVGRVKSDLGIYPSAIYHFKSALEVIDLFVAKHNGGVRSASTSADICGLKTFIAQCYYSHGDLEEALREYNEVAEMLYEINIANRAEILSNVLSMRGNIRMEMGEVTRAMESFVDAARELVSASSFDPSSELPLVLPSLFQAYGVQFHTAAAAA